MKVIKVKLKKYEDFIEGYGLMTFPSEEEQLNKIMKKIPDGYKYIRHFVHGKFTPYIPERYYTPKTTNLKIRYGTQIFYMSVYIQ